MKLLAALLCALLATSCAAATQSPQDRAVQLETAACGHASRTSGGAVIAGEELIIAAAHVVAGASEVTATGSFGELPAEVVAFDPRSDLALLQVDGLAATPVTIAAARSGDQVVVVRSGETAELSATIVRRVEVRIEAVRSTERISRFGYELDQRVDRGDSGSGVYNAAGELVGIVFGRSFAGGDRSFVVRDQEMQQLLEADRSTSWRCDPAQHRVVSGP